MPELNRMSSLPTDLHSVATLRPVQTAIDTDQTRVKLATACRVMAQNGLAEDILGHISLRVDGGMLLRCRGPQEKGLLFTETEDIRSVDAMGMVDDPTGSYAAPNEYPIHRQVMLRRPDVMAVVHAHPPAVVAADLAGLELRPIVGAYNIPAMRMASMSIPIYPRGVLINRTDLADDLASALGESDVCILRGHGIVAVGESVEQAMVRALNVDALARMTLSANSAGNKVPEIPVGDRDEMPDLGSTFNDSFVWRHYAAKLELAGLSLHP